METHGLEITMEQARAPMGLQKAEHIKAISRLDDVAEDGMQLEQALCAWDPPPVSYLQLLGEEQIAAKVAAISLYRSQMDNLFGSASAMPTRVTAYASILGAGRGHAERYWEGGVLCPATCA